MIKIDCLGRDRGRDWEGGGRRGGNGEGEGGEGVGGRRRGSGEEGGSSSPLTTW